MSNKFQKGDVVRWSGEYSVDFSIPSMLLVTTTGSPKTFWGRDVSNMDDPVRKYHESLWELVDPSEYDPHYNDDEYNFEDYLDDDWKIETDEVRVTSSTEMYTDPNTGGMKEKKAARYDLIPTGPLWKVAEMYGVGASKYDERNWEKSYPMSLSYASMQRHANQFWSGEDDDKETGIPHLASVVFHAMAMMEFLEKHPEQDDRPKNGLPF